MTVQIVEIAGQKMAMLPFADYQQLLELAEDKDDARAAGQAAQRRSDGEEYLSADMVDRLLAGESALRLWRKHRGMTLRTLAAATGTGVSHLSEIENGKRRGHPKLWRALAEALKVSADDILPVDG